MKLRKKILLEVAEFYLIVNNHINKTYYSSIYLLNIYFWRTFVLFYIILNNLYI